MPYLQATAVARQMIDFILPYRLQVIGCRIAVRIGSGNLREV